MSQETKRLYFDDPYQVEFEASVVSRVKHRKKPALILDQTCFYPESGGQPADKGTLNGARVIQVLEDDGNILHVLEEEVSAGKVKGKIDWAVRFDHMQQHAGQHILSQAFFRLLDGETQSFHLGEAASMVEIGLSRVSEEDLEKIEALANSIVFENREIKTYFIPEEKVSAIPLRRLPKKSGLIRVVEISGFDYSACGGTHPRRSGEVGLIKILKWERIRDNLRFAFVCGGRALKDYALRHRVLRQVAIRFSSTEEEVLASLETLFSGLKEEKRKNKEIKKRLLEFEAQQIIQESGERIIKKILCDKEPEEVRSLALNIIKSGEHVILYGLDLKTRVHLVFACSESLGLDMRELIPAVAPLVKGRGGGSPSLVEIGGESRQNLEQALEEAWELVSKKLSGFS